MKRTVRKYFLLLFLSLLLFPFSFSFADTAEADFSYRVCEDDSAALLSYTGTGKIVTLPDEIDGHPVSLIESSCFLSAEKLSVILIPFSVTIEANAFSGCEALCQVIFLAEPMENTDVHFLLNCPEAMLYIRQDCSSLLSLAEAHDLPFTVFDTLYIANGKTKKLHFSTCSSVTDMSEKNKLFLFDRDEAVSLGFVPCKRCDP